MQEVTKAEDEQQKKSLLRKSGEIIGDVIGSQFETTAVETEIELNLAVVKIKHTVKRNKNNEADKY